jgi:hypothetical protein
MKNSDIEIVSVNTFMEHKEILKRMYDNSDVVLLPNMKPFEIKEMYGSPCFSKQQDYIIECYQNGNRKPWVVERVMGVDKNGDSWRKYAINNTAKRLLLSGELHKISPKCCKILKKDVFKQYEKITGKKAILGVRASEGELRRTKYNKCLSKDGTFHPLYDLTDDLLHEIEERYSIEVPEIYKYVKRTGCMGCPYGSYLGDTINELKLVTKEQRKFLSEYFRESYNVLGIDIELIQAFCGDIEVKKGGE